MNLQLRHTSFQRAASVVSCSKACSTFFQKCSTSFRVEPCSTACCSAVKLCIYVCSRVRDRGSRRRLWTRRRFSLCSWYYNPFLGIFGVFIWLNTCVIYANDVWEFFVLSFSVRSSCTFYPWWVKIVYFFFFIQFYLWKDFSGQISFGRDFRGG